MTQIAEPPQDERAKVESWRLHVLMEAGFSLPLAEKLAHSEADLHRRSRWFAAAATTRLRPDSALAAPR
jgi:hypothetical protein